MPKTLDEIHTLARERQPEKIRELTCRELEVLFFALNRIRYSGEEEEDYIRFYMAVHSALEECRADRKPAA